MSRGERDRLRDIKDAIITIHEHLARTSDTPTGDDAALLHDALLFQFGWLDSRWGFPPVDRLERRRAQLVDGRRPAHLVGDDEQRP